jgi:hypothetical protein
MAENMLTPEEEANLVSDITKIGANYQKGGASRAPASVNRSPASRMSVDLRNFIPPAHMDDTDYFDQQIDKDLEALTGYMVQEKNEDIGKLQKFKESILDGFEGINTSAIANMDLTPIAKLVDEWTGSKLAQNPNKSQTIPFMIQALEGAQQKLAAEKERGAGVDKEILKTKLQVNLKRREIEQKAEQTRAAFGAKLSGETELSGADLRDLAERDAALNTMLQKGERLKELAPTFGKSAGLKNYIQKNILGPLKNSIGSGVSVQDAITSINSGLINTDDWRQYEVAVGLLQEFLFDYAASKGQKGRGLTEKDIERFELMIGNEKTDPIVFIQRLNELMMGAQNQHLNYLTSLKQFRENPLDTMIKKYGGGYSPPTQKRRQPQKAKGPQKTQSRRMLMLQNLKQQGLL